MEQEVRTSSMQVLVEDKEGEKEETEKRRTKGRTVEEEDEMRFTFINL